MGRLMDDIMAMVGAKPSDRVPFTRKPSDTSPSPSDPEYKPEPEDCLACRIIGVSSMTALGIFVVGATYKHRLRYKGRQQFGLIMAGTSLSCSFFWMAVCRAFDIGIFDKTKEDMTVKARIEEEINIIKTFAAKQKESAARERESVAAENANKE